MASSSAVTSGMVISLNEFLGFIDSKSGLRHKRTRAENTSDTDAEHDDATDGTGFAVSDIVLLRRHDESALAARVNRTWRSAKAIINKREH
jgi:hypothetical protein